jgi:hypothetical protein
MWKKLESHYQSKAIANQAKVYNNFLAMKFKGTNIDQFITNITSQISNLRAVELCFGISKDFEIHENLFCESILDKIPSSLIHTREVLIQKQPLTIESITDSLNNRSCNNATVKIKSEELAMKAVSKPSDTKFTSTWHNPNANHIKACCFELYPKQTTKSKNIA